MNDLKQAFRQLRKHPFTNGVIVLTMALLIGAVSVIYASLRNEQARYTPFPESERLVKLWRTGENRIQPFFPGSHYVEYAARLKSFEELGALIYKGRMTLTDAGEPVTYTAFDVSASLLRLTRVPPLMGRIFDEADESDNAQVVLIPEEMWRKKLGADDQIIGRELRLNDRIYTVIGVLPERIRNTRLGFNMDILLPGRFNGRSGTLSIFGRLKPGVSMRGAQAELNALAPALETNHSPNEHERVVYPGGYQGARIASLNQQFANRGQGIPAELVFFWIFGGTIIVSVVGIACFNITNLLLARVSGRSREMAIRISLGANRSRILRQLLTETVLLAGMGGLLGLLVSFWFFGLLRFQHVDARLDWRLYFIAAGGAFVLGILVGLLPALRSAQTGLTEALKEGGQSIGRRRHRLRNFLVSSEVAMALILCSVTSLIARSCLEFYTGELGFDPEKMVLVRVDLRNDIYREMEDRHAYADRGLEALRELPGIEAAAVSSSASLMGWILKDQLTVRIPGSREEQVVESQICGVTKDWAGLNGMRLLRGRDLSEDSKEAANEAIVNQTFVAAVFRSEDPLGCQIRIGRADSWVTIVGVVKDRHPVTTYQGSGQPEVLVGRRHGHLASGAVFLVQTIPVAKAMSPSIRETLQKLDLNQPVSQPVWLPDLLENRAAGPRIMTSVLAALASIGLFIALMGLYGVVAFTVTERTREVGIRLAVGATRFDVLRLILWQGGRLLAFGTVPGVLIGSLIVAGMPRQMEVSSFDPLTLMIVILIISAAGLLASLLPARKAANLNPVEALRQE